jgi:hypothetical protein
MLYSSIILLLFCQLQNTQTKYTLLIHILLFMYKTIIAYFVSIESKGMTNLNGKWTYRSYHNNPDPSEDDRWGIYELSLEQNGYGILQGKLDSGDPDEVYMIEGNIDNNRSEDYDNHDKCFNIKMSATGSTKQTEGHIYKYQGQLIPRWPEGKNQVTAIIGTVIRTKYPNNPSQEGIVGCFVATKHQ